MTTAKRVSHETYRKKLLSRFKNLRAAHFSGKDELFDPSPRRYYLFKPENAAINLFDKSLGSLVGEREIRQFADMGSSQALALSVFGTLNNRGGLGLLAKVPDEDEVPLLAGFMVTGEPTFGFKVEIPEDATETRLDLVIPGSPGRLVFATRLLEQEYTHCPEAVSGECNGNFEAKPGVPAIKRCPLALKGSRYWDLMTTVFHWDKDLEYMPCTMRDTYGMAQQMLAASLVSQPGQAAGEQLFIMICDLNNPSFQRGGLADLQFRMAHAESRKPGLVKSTTWQWLAQALKEDGSYEDLLAWLEAKYGIVPRPFESNEVRDTYAC